VSDSEPAIVVEHLSHKYDERLVLDDVSFTVQKGEIFGFIGPNGAGKTTTIRILATLLEPTAGRVEVGGYDVTIDPHNVRRRLGFMADHAGIYERLTVHEYLEFFARANRLPPASVVDAAIELTEIGALAPRLVASLSKGQKQRLQLARILLHDPEVLVLDEPASDLDPRARIEMRQLFADLRGLGKTILLSSHILTELADVCTSVGILEHGKIVATGSLDELLAQTQPPSSRGTGGVRKKLSVRLLSSPEDAKQALAGVEGVSCEIVDAGLDVTFQGDDDRVADIVTRLVTAGVRVVHVEQVKRELERVFLELTRGERHE
jgi:ABC-2 type transport system ATP-binding protein